MSLTLEIATACLAVDRINTASASERISKEDSTSSISILFSWQIVNKYFLVTESNIPRFKLGVKILSSNTQPTEKVGPVSYTHLTLPTKA